MATTQSVPKIEIFACQRCLFRFQVAVTGDLVANLIAVGWQYDSAGNLVCATCAKVDPCELDAHAMRIVPRAQRPWVNLCRDEMIEICIKCGQTEVVE